MSSSNESSAMGVSGTQVGHGGFGSGRESFDSDHSVVRDVRVSRVVLRDGGPTASTSGRAADLVGPSAGPNKRKNTAITRAGKNKGKSPSGPADDETAKYPCQYSASTGA